MKSTITVLGPGVADRKKSSHSGRWCEPWHSGRSASSDYLGIDIRAAELVNASRTFRSSIAIECDGMRVDLPTTIASIRLEARRFRMLIIQAEGPDAEAAVATLANLILAKGDGGLGVTDAE